MGLHARRSLCRRLPNPKFPVRVCAVYQKNSEVCQQLVEAQKLLAAAQESLQLKEDALTKVTQARA